MARHYAGARLSEAVERGANKYNPVGYILSADKDAEDEKLQRREAMVEDRRQRLAREAAERAGSVPVAKTATLVAEKSA